MNTKEFVAWLRVYLEDKNKLSKKETQLLKEILASTYNELPVDIVFANLPSIQPKNTGGEFVPNHGEIWMGAVDFTKIVG